MSRVRRCAVLFRHACLMGLEGLVSRQRGADACLRAGDIDQWHTVVPVNDDVVKRRR